MKDSPSPAARHRYGQSSAWEGSEYREKTPIVQSKMMQISKGLPARANDSEEIIGDLKSKNRKLEEEKRQLKLEWRTISNQQEDSENEADDVDNREHAPLEEKETQDERREPAEVREPAYVSAYTFSQQKGPLFQAASPQKKPTPSQITFRQKTDPILEHRQEYDAQDDEDATSVQLEVENEKLKREWEAMKQQLARAQQEKESREKLMAQTQKVLASSYSKSLASDSDDDDSEEESPRPSSRKYKNRSKSSHRSRGKKNQQSPARVDEKKTKKSNERKRTTQAPRLTDDAQQIPMSSSETICIDEKEVEVRHSFSGEYFSDDSCFSAEKHYVADTEPLARKGSIVQTEREVEEKEVSNRGGGCTGAVSDTNTKNNDQNQWLSPEPLGLVYKSQLDESVARETSLRKQMAQIKCQVEDAGKGLLAAEQRERKLGSAVSTHRKKIADLTDQVEELQENNRDLSENTRLLSQEKSLLQDQTEQQRQALATYERQLEAAGIREIKLREELDDSRKKAELAIKDTEDVKEHAKALNEAHDATKLELQAALDQLKATREENLELRGMGRHQEEMKALMEKVQLAMKEKLQQQLQNIAALDSQVKEGAAREASLEKDLASATLEGESSRRQLEEEAMMRQRDMEGTISTHHTDLEIARERIVALEQSLAELQEATSQEKEVMVTKAQESKETLESLNTKLGEVSIREALLQKEVADLIEAAASKEKNLGETERKLKEAGDSFSSTHRELEAAQERIVQLEAQIEELQGITDEVGNAMQGQIEEEKTMVARLEGELGETRSRGEQLQKELEDSKKAIEILQKELEEAKSYCKEVETKLTMTNGDLASTRERVSMMTEQNKELRGINSKLEEEKEGVIAELKGVEQTLYQKNMEGVKVEAANEREASEKLLRMTIAGNKKAAVEKSALQAQLDKANMRVWYLEREVDRLQQNNDQLEGQIVQYVREGETICGVPAGFLGLGGSGLDLVPSLDQPSSTKDKFRSYKRG